jgi:argininosuccinate lyase
MDDQDNSAAELTGRITSGPADVLHRTVLEPQFRFEARCLLPHYVHLEKVLLLEYRRMGVLTWREVTELAQALEEATEDRLAAGLRASMSDISFALERFVLGRLDAPVPAWHVDRSRNDLQATAQLMFGRQLTIDAADTLIGCAEAAHRRAGEHVDDVMPGYTHLQAAQVVSPAFWLSALTGRLLHALDRLGRVYDGLDACPLGSGAMSGQELDWDRERMSRLLGFTRAEPHALTGVASREWLLDLSAACSTTGVVTGRFVTDLMAWASGAYGFCELPDELSGISSAMPQKKNYPVLERIRGKAAHLTSWYVDVATTQRAVTYSNTVEVSKEGSAQLETAMSGFGAMLELLRVVLDRLEFRTDRMRAACEGEHLGGFSLANRLTLDHKIPWRTAQVVAGQYITAARDAGLPPSQHRPDLLIEAAARHGHALTDPLPMLREAFDPDREMARRRSSGSSEPAAVSALLEEQAEQLARLTRQWQARARTVQESAVQADSELAAEARAQSGLSER